MVGWNLTDRSSIAPLNVRVELADCSRGMGGGRLSPKGNPEKVVKQKVGYDVRGKWNFWYFDTDTVCDE